MSDLTPLPWWKQKAKAFGGRWRRSADRRKVRLAAFKSVARRGTTLAISVVGGTLISYGVWMIYDPAGFVTGGILLWVVQWNYGEGEGRE